MSIYHWLTNSGFARFVHVTMRNAIIIVVVLLTFRCSPYTLPFATFSLAGTHLVSLTLSVACKFGKRLPLMKSAFHRSLIDIASFMFHYSPAIQQNPLLFRLRLHQQNLAKFEIQITRDRTHGFNEFVPFHNFYPVLWSSHSTK